MELPMKCVAKVIVPVICLISLIFVILQTQLIYEYEKIPSSNGAPIASATNLNEKRKECYPDPCITSLNKTTYNKLFELNNEEKDIPIIDIVITWAGQNSDKSNVRIRDNLELKYCLRSIYTFIPWFNHIFLVVNNETFYDILHNNTFINAQTLNMQSNKITIINTFDLFCNCSQCFDSIDNTNSISIETTLHKIPHLSEYYIYFNDDWFILKPIHWSYFYLRLPPPHSDTLYIRMPYLLYKTYSSIGGDWYRNLYKYLFYGYDYYKTSTNIFENTYDGNKIKLNETEIKLINVPYSNINSKMKRFWNHSPIPYIKKHIIEFENEYLNWFKFVRSHKRRYALVTEALYLHFIKRLIVDSQKYKINLDLLYYPYYDDIYFNILIKAIKKTYVHYYYYHYWLFGKRILNSTVKLKSKLNEIATIKPATICINDDGQSAENIKIVQYFCDKHLPIKSPIEK